MVKATESSHTHILPPCFGTLAFEREIFGFSPHSEISFTVVLRTTRKLISQDKIRCYVDAK